MKHKQKIFIERTADFVLKNRWYILAANLVVMLVLFGFMGARGKAFNEHVEYLTELRNNPLSFDSNHVSPRPIMDPDYRVFFKEDNPDLMAYDKFQEVFAKEDQVIVVIRSKSGNLFTNENLKTLKAITDNAWAIPYVSRSAGLTNFNYTYVGVEPEDEDDDEFDAELDDGYEESAEDNLLVEDLITTLPLSPEQLDAKKALVLGDSLLTKFMISKKGDITQISLTAIVPPAFPDGFEAIRAGVENLIQEHGAPNNDLEIMLGGTVMLNSTFFEFAMGDFKTMTPLMFLFIIGLLFLTLRSGWGTILPLIVLVSSFLFPILLFVGALNFSLTNLTMNTIQILTAVAIADSVHVLSVFYKELRKGESKYDAIKITIEKNYIACLITTITTAIGFFGLLLHDMPPFADLGLFAGVGTLYAFVATLYTLPAMLAILPIKASAKQVEKAQYSKVNALFEKLEMFIHAKQSGIRVGALLLTIAAVYFATQIKIDNTTLKYFEEGTEFRSASEYMDENIIGTNPVEFQFDSGEQEGMSNPLFLKKIERFVEYIKDSPEFDITYTSSIVDVVKRLNKTMHGDKDEYYTIPVKDSVTAEGDTLVAKKLIAQYLLLYEMSLPQGMDMNNQRSIDRRYARVTAFMTSAPSTKQIENTEALNAWLKKEMPEVNAVAVGVPVMFGKMANLAIPGMLKGLALSLFMITLTLAITFRSLKVALFSMIPNIWPILIMFGGIGLSGVEVNLSIAIVGMITLGIAVDDTVHFLVKYQHARRRGNSKDEAITWTFKQVGRPLLFTSIILIAGFGILMLSQFAMSSDMGLYCSVVIALALIADFILLPAMLLKYQK
ncbi:MAG: MMPL family transporter [Fibrobacterales bacterium]